MSFNKKLNYCLNVFCPYIAILLILYFEGLLFSFSSLLIIGLLYFAQRSAFHMAYDFSFQESLEDCVDQFIKGQEDEDFFLKDIIRRLEQNGVDIDSLNSNSLQIEIAKILNISELDSQEIDDLVLKIKNTKK